MQSTLSSIGLILCTLALTGGLWAQELRILNNSSPGQRFEALDYLRKNKQNIVVFTSSQSEECARFQEVLERLERQKSGLAIGLLDVDRPESTDVDWKSPLVRQYNLRELPYVMVFGDNKEIRAQGHQARKLILRWLDES